MNRREILRYTALLTGSAVCSPLMSTILSGCTTGQKENQESYQPQFFSKEQYKLVMSVVDIILPKTDSPAGTEAGVHQTIDSIIAKVYKKEEKEQYASSFAKLENYLLEKNFEKLNVEEKTQLLQSLDEGNPADPIRKAFKDLKQQSIAFFLSNETIAENYLNYLPVPGDYEPCISLSEAGGKAWAI